MKWMNMILILAPLIFGCGVNPERAANLGITDPALPDKVSAKIPSPTSVRTEVVDVESKKIASDDLAPSFDETLTVEQRCTGYELEIESRFVTKDSNNSAVEFGPYFLTSPSAFSETAPVFQETDCSVVPIASDAPDDIVSLLKSNVQWLQADDILTMKAPLRVGEGKKGQAKIGSVSVFRRTSQTEGACASNDAFVVCSKSRNPVALSFDIATHYMLRANFHRKHGAGVQKCEDMLKKVVEFTSKDLQYDGKLIYQTNNDKRLQPSEIKATIEEMKIKASTMLNSGWCQQTDN